MRYETPQLTEIKMDAEIGSYQDDFDPLPVDRIDAERRGAPEQSERAPE